MRNLILTLMASLMLSATAFGMILPQDKKATSSFLQKPSVLGNEYRYRPGSTHQEKYSWQQFQSSKKKDFEKWLDKNDEQVAKQALRYSPIGREFDRQFYKFVTPNDAEKVAVDKAWTQVKQFGAQHLTDPLERSRVGKIGLLVVGLLALIGDIPWWGWVLGLAGVAVFAITKQESQAGKTEETPEPAPKKL